MTPDEDRAASQAGPRRHEKGEPSPRLDALAHEVGEARKQMIKTANTIGKLTAEVRTIGRQQRQERRGLTLNSAAAYVLFVALVVSGFYFLYSSQVDRMTLEKNALIQEHAASRSRLEQLRKSAERRRKAEARAATFYRLSQSGQVQKALQQYPEVAQLPLSPVESAVFQTWVNRVRNRIAFTAYSTAMKAVKDKAWKRATAKFRLALKHVPHPPHEASLRYYLGVALMNLGSYKEAADELEAALKVGAEKSVSREVRFHLGGIYEQIGQRRQAIRAYRAYIKRFPGTNYARAARRRVKALK